MTGTSIASGSAIGRAGSGTSYSSRSPSSSGRLDLMPAPFTVTSPRLIAAATAARGAPAKRATTTSAATPASSALPACCKRRDDQEANADRDARVRNVEDVRPNSVEVDEIDHVSVMYAIDDIGDRAAGNHAECDANRQRLGGCVAKTVPKQHEDDDRHRDQQHAVAAEQS